MSTAEPPVSGARPPAAPRRLATYFHVHLVSDSTAETLNLMAKAVVARFEGVIPIEHIYALVRSPHQLERVLEEIEAQPGIVMHTLVDPEQRSMLEVGCRKLNMPQIGALDPLVAVLGGYLGANLSSRVGAQHALDNDYFDRIGALDYAMQHDDGQGLNELERADVVLVGVSRTSKTPTCVYLAHRGVWAGNIPLVPGQDPPAVLKDLKNPLIVGLVVSPDRLVSIRRNRLQHLGAETETDYVDLDLVREETIRARRLFEKLGWPVIDVSRRSVEETAAQIINLISARRTGKMGVPS